MDRARRYTLALAACLLALFGAGHLGWLSVHAATEYGLQFDGVDDRVTFGAAPGLGAANFTLELWFMRQGSGVTTSSGTGGVIAVPLITKGTAEVEGSNKDMNYFLGIEPTTRVLTADFEDMNNGLNHPVKGKTAICDNVWYHAAATYDSTTGTWRLYLNGELEAQSIVTGTALVRTPRSDSIQHAGLGTAMNSTGVAGGFFKGMMDEVRIWNVARSQADIQSTMGVPVSTSAANLIGRWGLDDGVGTTALNSIPGSPNGSLLPLSAPPALPGPPVWVAGGSGYATTPLPAGNVGLHFTGTTAAGDYVALEKGPYPLTSTTLGAAKFTIETWFKREAVGVPISTGTGGLTSMVPLVTKGRGEAEASNVDFNYFLGLNTAGANTFIAGDFEEGAAGTMPGLNHPLSGITPIVTGTWYHAAMTYDGTVLSLYLNGGFEGSLVVGQPPRFDSIQPAALGSALNSAGASSGFFAGTLDETRIWNYARTGTQIDGGRNREITNADGLLGRWGYNERCGCIIDSSNHQPNGNLLGASWAWVSTPALTGAANVAPTVDAGADQTVTLPALASLHGVVVDDGVNTGVPFSTQWSKVSGPGTATFTSGNTADTDVTFSVAGTYVLKLTVSDGDYTVNDVVTVQVTSAAANLAPTANAGPDQVVTFPAPVQLTGSYTDDGLPGVDIDTTWSVVSGPGTVTIAEPFELNTSVTFSATGTYVLRLTADDSLLSGTDTVTITVSAVSTNYGIDLNGTNAAVTLGAAPGLGASVFTLEAWIKREGAGVATSTGTSGVVAVPIVTKGMAQADGSNLDMNYFLGIRSTDNVLVADFEDMATGLNHPIAGVTAIPTDGTWRHVAATYDGTTWRLYLNGVQDASVVVGSFTPRADSIQHAAIGTALGSGGTVPSGQTQGFFNGVIDEVRIWNVARSLSDIQGGMTGEVGSSPSLLGRWGLNEGTGGAGTVIADGSGHGINGTAVGTFTWVPGAPFSAPNHAPAAPVLVAPALAATNVSSPATLSVSVSDTDNDPMTVTYFGRKKTATAPDFTYVTIPDTQHYVDNTNFPGTFTAQTNWIVANRAAMNIAFVSQLGDLTEHLDAQPIEWTRADTSMKVLDVAGIPYGTAPGNHDQSATGVAAMYDLTFPPSRYLGQPWYLGYMGANAGEMNRLNKDNYEEFTVGGLKFLVIHIELDWPAYAVTWADQVIKAHPNHRVILSSHLFLDTTNTRPTVAQFRTTGPVAEQGMSAEAVWQQLVKPNCNVFMVVNGHYPGEGKRTDLNSCGQPVHQVLMDYQSRANGGDGWLRYFRFQPSQNKISALTYSVTRNEFETDADSQFDLTYDMQGTPFTVIGTQTGVSTGPSSVSWAGLDAGSDYEWYATVNDGKQTTTGPLWNFTAMSANVAPVASDDTYNVNEDASLTVPAPGVLGNDTDANLNPLTVSVGTSPQHGALTLNVDGSFTYTPDHDYNGPDSFTYTANDGTLASNVATVSITVAPVNDAPVAANDAFFVNEDQTLTITAPGVLANDSDPDAGSLHAVLVGAAAHGAVTLNADGSFTYAPNANFNGADAFTYKANDNTADSNVATVAITVESVNDAPVAVNDTYSATEDTPLSVPGPGVLGNDTDGDSNPLTAILASGPAHGAVTLNVDGSFTYTPALNFNGSDSFTYKANDGTADSNIATVAITVGAVNDAPLAVNDSYSATEDTLLSVAAPGALGNDSDVDGNTLSAILASGPAHGAVTLSADGSFTYMPNANFNGADAFTYKANDGTTDSNVATVSITVGATNDAPVAVNDSYSGTEDTPLTIAAPGVLGGDSDADGDALAAIVVSQPAHGTVTLNADGSFSYLPAPNFNGSDAFTYQANDGTTDSNIATVAISVTATNDAPVAANDSYTGTEDTPLTIAAPGVLGNDSDVDGDALAALIVSQPAHGAVALNADGSFTYTPALNFNGSDSFTYKANDGSADSNVATVSISVTATNDAPVAANDSYSGTEDTPLTIAAPGVVGNDSDADGDALTALLVSGPSHGSLSLNAGGGFTYTPAPNFNGSDSFTYKANDGSADSNIATVAITIAGTNDAPVAVNDSYSGTEDTPLTIAAPGVLGNDSDVDGDALAALIVSQPAHGAVTVNADGSFTYTPALNFNGSDAFTYKANDGTTDSNIATVAITIAGTNDAPVAANDSYSGTEDTPLTIAAPGVIGNDSDADGDTLTALLVSGPSHGSLSLNASGGFTYTPALNFNGSDSFTYKANDGAADSNVATVSISVAAANDAPVAGNDSYSGTEDTPLTIAAPGVLGNDSDVDGDMLTALVVAQPAHGAVTLNVDGSFTYTPVLNFNGSDSFSYKANDGTTDSNIATVAITIAGTNDAPVAVNDSYSGTEDTPLTIAAPGVVGNDSDADGDALTAVLVGGPAHGTVTVNPNGGFTYTPAANYNGSDSFSYKANDGTADSNVATVSISVAAANDAPVAGNDSYSGTEDTPLTIAAPGVLGNDSDVDGDALTAVVVAQPAHGAVTLNANGSFTYTPALNFNGSDAFTYKASDGTIDSNVATVAITIAGTNDAPVAANDSYSGTEDTPLTIAAPGVVGNDSDADGDALTAVLVGGPAHGTVTVNPNGGFTYTPAANYNGNDSFTYKANDGTIDSNVATVAITIAGTNDAPVAADDSYNGTEDTLLTIAAPGVAGNDSDADGDALTVLLVSGPAHGTLALNANGSFTYMPAANYNGSDSFTYKVNDGAADSNVATVAITVGAVNDAPVAANDSYSATEDTPLIVAAPGVVGNDTDADGNALTAVVVTQPAHGAVTLNANGGFTYTPALNYNGSDSFTYKANDGAADSNVATVAITVAAVNDAPVAANDSYYATGTTPLTVPSPGVLANDSDVDSSSLQASLVTGPGHGTLTLNTNGGFTFTAASGFSGSDSFTYKVSDGTASSNTATVTISVSGVNEAPVAQDQAVQAETAKPASIVLAATDREGHALTYRIVRLPQHGTLTGAPPNLQYTSAKKYLGSDSLTFVANDGTSDSNVATVSITVVKDINDPPVAYNQAVQTREDEFVRIKLTADDPDKGATLTFNVVTGPAHGTLTVDGKNVKYTPNPDYNGPDSFTFQASDSTLVSNLGTVSITVTPVNDPPAAQDQSVVTNSDQPVTIVLAATDVEGSALTYRIVNQPRHGTLSGTGATRIYTPASHYFGPDSFTFVANDGTDDSDVATVSITVKKVNHAPVAQNQSVQTDEDDSVWITLTADDADGDALDFDTVTQPAHGTVFGPGRIVRYKPDPNYNGPDSFTFRASDKSLTSNVATVSITVRPVNDPPVAQDQSVLTNSDQPVAIVLAATDLEGSPLTYRVINQPRHGTLSGTGATRTYTPASRYFGADSFTFVANDGTDDSDVATVSITVKKVNHAPVAQNQSVQTDEDDSVWITLTADDADGDSLDFDTVGQPAHGTVFGPGRIVRYKPDPNYHGPDSFTFRVSDRTLSSNLATVNITVASVNDAPEANRVTVSTSRGNPVSGLLSANDADGDTLRYRMVVAPRKGTVTINQVTGAFTYRPDSSSRRGQDYFKYVANDGHVDSDPARVVINLDGRYEWNDSDDYDGY